MRLAQLQWKVCGLDTLVVVCKWNWDREQWRVKGQGGVNPLHTCPLSARNRRESTCF